MGNSQRAIWLLTLLAVLGLVAPAVAPVLGAAEPTSSAASKPATRPASLPASPPVDEKAVAELIRLLGADSYQVREDATKRLTGMVGAAYPLLEAKLQEQYLDPEVATRIDAVLANHSYAFDAKEAARRQEKAAKALGVPKELSLDVTAKLNAKLVLIPPGTFWMGSPKEEQRHGDDEERHRVTISKAFYMGTHPVTRGEFAAFVADTRYRTDAERAGSALALDGNVHGMVAGASWKNPGFEQPDDHPALCISHNDATAFCNWLAKKTGRAVRLPTEAEWEHACRAGTTTAYQWGDDPDDGKGWCNVADRTAQKWLEPNWGYFSWDDGHMFTSPVGKFKANAFGLHDMHGNAFQWCSDWYNEMYYGESPRTDPQGPATGSARAMRGTGWLGRPVSTRTACRDAGSPGFCSSRTGLRIVVEIEKK